MEKMIPWQNHEVREVEQARADLDKIKDEMGSERLQANFRMGTEMA